MERRAEAGRFLVDEMLARLGRWLRAAGHDTLIPRPGASDAELMATARGERRLLITRDRKLTEFRDADQWVVWLRANTTEECARELGRRIRLDWLRAPFTRCLVCNTPLTQGADADIAAVPEHSRRVVNAVWRCPGCQRLYWHGGHVRRMRRRLESLAAHQRHEGDGQDGP